MCIITKGLFFTISTKPLKNGLIDPSEVKTKFQRSVLFPMLNLLLFQSLVNQYHRFLHPSSTTWNIIFQEESYWRFAFLVSDCFQTLIPYWSFFVYHLMPFSFHQLIWLSLSFFTVTFLWKCYAFLCRCSRCLYILFFLATFNIPKHLCFWRSVLVLNFPVQQLSET